MLNGGWSYREQVDAAANGWTVLDYYSQRYAHSSRAEWGDRILTDTIVGNRLGMFTILIQPPHQGSDTSWLGGRSQIVRNWENWLMHKSGIGA